MKLIRMFAFCIFGAVVALKRDYIRRRQREAIEIAKSNGRYKGRKRIESRNFDSIHRKWKNGELSAAEAMKIFVVSSSTFYRRVRERGTSRYTRHIKNDLKT